MKEKFVKRIQKKLKEPAKAHHLFLIFFTAIFMVSFVDAVQSQPTAVFDLYYVMVEVLFGSVLVSGLAMAFLMTVICLLGRVSLFTIIIWVGFFLVVFLTGYYGSAFLIISAIASFLYAGIAGIRYAFPDV